jgi:hypothetical protein
MQLKPTMASRCYAAFSLLNTCWGTTMIVISWRRYTAVIALAAVLANGCSAARPLHRSSANIRTSLLKSTPPGTSKKEVIAKIGWRVDQKSGPFAAQAQESGAWDMLRSASKQAGSPPVSKEVKSVLEFDFGSYFIWFGSCDVIGVWGFDSEDHLLEIWVYKSRDVL